MSTKAVIQASNDAIRDDPDFIQPSEDCDNRDLYLQELFPELIDVLSSDTTYATAVSDASYPYKLLISKNGGRVSVNGKIRNATFVDQSNTLISTITDSELLVSDREIDGVTARYVCHARNPLSGITITLYIQDNGGDTVFRVFGSFPACVTSSDWYEIQECLQYNTKN